MRSLDLVLLPLLLLLTLLMRGCVEGQQQGLHVKGPEPSMADYGEFGYGVDGDWDSRRESVRKAMSETVSTQPQHKTVSKTLSKQTVPSGRPQIKIGPNNKIPSKTVSHNSRCQEPPKRVLRQILGPAFIDMYMMDELSPEEIDSSLGLSEEPSLNKRWQRQSILAHESSRPFYLTEDFQEPLSEEPAWELKYDTTGVAIGADSSGNYRTAKGRRHIMLSADSSNVDMLGEGSGGSMAREDAGELRVKRSRTPMDERLWHCEAPIRFRDLGENYYPRYIREVDCSGCPEEPDVKCKSRNFEVRVLRRQDECAPISHMPGFVLVDEASLHEGMWRKWIVERVSVSFCCVCGRF